MLQHSQVFEQPHWSVSPDLRMLSRVQFWGIQSNCWFGLSQSTILFLPAQYSINILLGGLPVGWSPIWGESTPLYDRRLRDPGILAGWLLYDSNEDFVLPEVCEWRLKNPQEKKHARNEML